MIHKINTQKIMERITHLHKARSSHFNDEDEHMYWSANTRLNRARKDLEIAYTWNRYVESLEVLPKGEVKNPKNHCYTRYETLDRAIQIRITQLFKPSLHSCNVYVVDSKYIARSLKDAVCFCENHEFPASGHNVLKEQ